MKSLLFHVVYNFQSWMLSYFATVALAVLAISAVAGWLWRSHKPALVTYVTIMALLAAYMVCQRTDLTWRIYFS